MIPDLHEPESPWRDPIVAKVRSAREQLLAGAVFEPEILGRQLRESQDRSGRQALTLPPRRPEGQGTAAS
jgi:hypothetical protein